MILEKALESASEHLKSKVVKDAVIGISLIAVQLDDDAIGSSYVLREDIPGGCSIFPYSKGIIGENAYNIARWALEGDNVLKRAVGIAVLNAGSANQDLKNAERTDGVFSVDITASDTVGMVGFIGPAVKGILDKTDKLIIFDKGKGHENVYDIKDQKKLLPTCDIVFITGTSFINQTFEPLLKMCKNAKEVVIVGASTPMYPKAFDNTNVTVLAGTWWEKDKKDEMFARVSLGAGIPDVSEFMDKMSSRIKYKV